MTNITLTLLAYVPLNQMNALEIGGNKSYINHGLFRHTLETVFVPRIQKALKNLAASPKNSLQLAVSGFLLPLMEKYTPETLHKLQSFVKTKNVKLLAVPYYGTSLHVLSEDEFIKQLEQEKDTLNKYFKKRSSGLFSPDGLVPKNYNEGTIFIGKKLIGDVTLSSLVKQIVLTPTITLGEETLAKTEFSEMEQHLLEEYKGLTPHVFATEDESLLTEWRFLGQAPMFTKADSELYLHESYDHYATFMNILNDIAHKIRTVELGKQGLFATHPQIVASPKRLLDEFR